MHTLIVATGNAGKCREIQQMLGETIQVKSLSDIPDAPDVVEDGDTFEANALKKARIIARHTSLPALADDSGLEVDALSGAPGVFSARFAGEDATDADNIAKLLGLLQNVPHADRTARFRCVMALVNPEGREQTAQGAWEGEIGHTPQGDNGFGYDPLFIVPTHSCTAAQLPPEIKNALSHRGQALKAIHPHILALYE